MADWRQEAARAVEAELEHVRQSGEWTELGRYRRTGDGEYAVDVRGRRVDPIDDVRLAGPEGPRHGPAVPARAQLRGGVLWLAVPGPLPPDCDRVWVRQVRAHESLQRLAHELRGLGHAPLADQLAAGELDRARDAYRACFRPGLRLVWGGPGTGKTTLIDSAAADLARAGKRVLVVTAADEAPIDPGHDAERLVIQEHLAELTAVEQQLAELDAALTGYDHAAFLAVCRRIENRERSASLEAEFAEARRRHEEASEELAAAQAELRAAREAWHDSTHQRARLTEARELSVQLATVSDAVSVLSDRLENRRRFYRGRRADRRALRDADADWARLEELIADCRAQAHPLTDDDAIAIEEGLTAAHDRLDAAAREETEAYTRLELVRGRIAQLRSVGVASDQDHRFHAECLRLDLPGVHAKREELRGRSPGRAARRGQLEERLWWLGERAHGRRYETGFSGRVVRASAARRFVAEQPFDVVLVDDAGSARLSDVLLAVAQARETAVLFGDLRRPGPRVRPQAIRNLPEVRRWTLTTPFAHCGIRTPEDAEAHPGCAVLTRQHRYGASVRALANSAGYDVLEGSGRIDTEVVLLDTRGSSPDYGAIVRFLTAAERASTAVVAPNRLQADAWLAAVRDRLSVAVGTARTLPGTDFDTVLVDLTGDDWAERVRSFGVAVTRVRRRLYLLGDLDAIKSAPIGTPLGSVNALRLQGSVAVRRLDEVVIPAPRRPQPAIDRHITVTKESASHDTMSG
ncbi:AAA domain-containing protein [Prauserella flavalba]|uniref:AAA domain-containing protein n=1 Tax=Prauserella flavalba TaxID=1477506 RepID=UPI0036E12F06